MKKTLLLVALVVVLAAPAMAAPRDDRMSDRGGFFGRIVRVVKALENYIVSPPKP